MILLMFIYLNEIKPAQLQLAGLENMNNQQC